ncbi:MAG: alcohol dehydrogenase catalytic domain-containing protein, partial [Parvibaculum sp.]
MKTEAAILIDTSKPLELVELELPAIKPGQILVEVTYSGACHTQILEARGHRGEDKWLPHCLGHEGTGRVLECGPGVTKVKAGNKVVLSWIKGNGIEAGGVVYTWDGKNVNAGGVTTFQRHAVVSENRLTALPEQLPENLSILLGCAAPTGMGAILNVAKVTPGDAVAIFGTGGVGLNACMAAAFSGGLPVIGVDPVASRRELALAFGATHVINPSAGNVLDQIKAIVPGGVD